MAIRTQSYFNGDPTYLCKGQAATDRDREMAFRRAVGVLRDGATSYEITDTETREIFTVTRHFIPKEN